MERLVSFGKALSDVTRVRILALLGEREVCVCEIVDVLGIPQSSLSTHLQTLRHAGMVNATKRGTWAYYSVAEGMRPILTALSSHFELETDASIQETAAKLELRLAMRECDCCVKGPGQLISKEVIHDRSL